MKKLVVILLCFSLFADAAVAQTKSSSPTKEPGSVANEPTSLSALYESAAQRGESLYITPDLAFERVHFFFASTLEQIEQLQLAPALAETLSDLEKALQKAHSRATDKLTDELLTRNEHYVQVARCLLSRYDDPRAGPVTEELKLIAEASRAAVSPVMGYLEDYTQYIPRGHYTKNEDLEKYFLALTWLGRAAFYIESNPAAGVSEELATRLTAQVMLLIVVSSRVKSVASGLAKFESALTALLGASDDLTLAEAGSLIARVAGERWTEVEDDYARIVTGQRVNPLRALMMADARRPRILGGFAAEGRSSPPLSVRVAGHRFSPDSYTFQNLTFDRVKDLTLRDARRPTVPARQNRQSAPDKSAPPILTTLSTTKQRRQVRGTPRGLDFMSALGSKLAKAELARSLDDSYEAYKEQSQKLQAEMPGLLKSDENFSSLYLLAIQNALREETRQSLNSALGAWTLLRYDLSAYVKQSYTSMPKSLPPIRPTPLTPPVIYVAPAAAVFTQLARAVELLVEQTELDRRDAGTRLAERLKLLASRAGQGPLVPGEASQVYATFVRQRGRESSVVISDVHTDPISGQVLQVALGIGRQSTFTVKDGKKAFGAVFTCYEFRRPSSQRMNDNQWRQELKENGAKYIPFDPGL